MEPQRIEQKPFRPTRTQALFLRNCQDNKYVNNFFVGGFGCGKTQILSQIVTDLAFQIPDNKIAVVRKYRVDLPDTTYQEFINHVNPALILEDRKADLVVVMRSRHPKYPSRIYFRGMDDRARWGSTFYGHIGVDESNELSELEYHTLPGRLRHKFKPDILAYLQEHDCPYLEEFIVDGEWKADVHRFMFSISNPTDMFHWLYRMCEEERAPSTSFVQASTYDNWDNLPHSYREIIDNYPAALKWTKVLGNWGVETVGRPCTPSFKEEVHFKSFSCTDFKPQKIYLGWDFGYSQPAIGLWFYDDKTNSAYKFSEIMVRFKRLEELCELADKEVNKYFPDVPIEDWVDYNAGRQHGMTGSKPAIEVMKKMGRVVRYKERNDPKDRADLIDTLFQRNKLVVHTRCKDTKAAYSGGWHYPEDGKGDPDAPDKNPRNPYHNLADADGYVLFGIFGAQGRAKELRRATRGMRSPNKFLNLGIGILYGNQNK